MMIKPYPPAKPVEPNKLFVQDKIEFLLHRSFKISDAPKFLKQALGQYRTPNLFVGDGWTLDEIQPSYGSIKLIWRGGEISWENPQYKKLMVRYEAQMKDYPEKLKAYQEKLMKYEMWFKDKDARAKERKRKMLLKQIKTAEKQLKEL